MDFNGFAPLKRFANKHWWEPPFHTHRSAFTKYLDAHLFCYYIIEAAEACKDLQLQSQSSPNRGMNNEITSGIPLYSIIGAKSAKRHPSRAVGWNEDTILKNSTGGYKSNSFASSIEVVYIKRITNIHMALFALAKQMC